MEKKENFKGSIFDRSTEHQVNDSFRRNESVDSDSPKMTRDQERRQRLEEEHRRSSEMEWKKNHYGR